MNKRFVGLLLMVSSLTAAASALDSDGEKRLMAVFFGRFANYIDLPNSPAKKYVITLIDEDPFGSLLPDLYKDKTIVGKAVEVRLVTRIEEIGRTDVLFVTLFNPVARQAAIDYAQKNSILTISQSKGFAERGGIIQLDFMEQGTRIKINHDAALKSNIRIGAPLLSLATVIRRQTP